MSPRTPDLVDALTSIADQNPLVAALRRHPGATAAVPHVVEHREEHGAIAVTCTVTGPGAADAVLLDLELDVLDLTLVSMRGGGFEAVHPPQAFAPVSQTLHPGLGFPASAPAELTIGSRRGRSSDGDMPFFLLADPLGEHGLWVAVGHSGSWKATLAKPRRSATHRLTVTGPGTDLDLQHGEALRLPTVYVGTYSGDGWAAVSAFIAARCPARSEPWVVYNTWFNLDAEIDQPRVLDAIAAAGEVGAEVFTLDAGWYVGDPSGPEDFQTSGIGTWELDTNRFPDGIEALSAAAHDAGLRFGLWFEMERAHPDSTVWRDHPGWIRQAPGQTFGVVDFGVEAARSWALERMSAAIRSWSLDWVKWDSNAHAMGAYFAGDERAELAHCRGVYAVMEALLQRHADLVLEGCASGGNRLDAEMLARCHTYWISDQTMNPAIVRVHLANAARWLPAQYRYTSVAPRTLLDEHDLSDDWFVSSMGGTFGLMVPLVDWSHDQRDRVAAHVATFKRLRAALDGRVTRFPATADAPLAQWEAWEVAMDDGPAALFAFRQGAQEESRAFAGRHRWDVTLPPQGAVAVARNPTAS